MLIWYRVGDRPEPIYIYVYAYIHANQQQTASGRSLRKSLIFSTHSHCMCFCRLKGCLRTASYHIYCYIYVYVYCLFSAASLPSGGPFNRVAHIKWLLDSLWRLRMTSGLMLERQTWVAYHRILAAEINRPSVGLEGG